MLNLLRFTQPISKTASLTIDSSLRTRGANAAWRLLGLPGGDARERVQKLFPASEVAAYALDVLMSGVPSENVLLRVDEHGEERFLLADFHPDSPQPKPKRVSMQVREVHPSESAERIEPLNTPEKRRTAAMWAARNGSHYLGRFQHRRADGAEVELEAVLALVDDRRPAQ